MPGRPRSLPSQPPPPLNQRPGRNPPARDGAPARGRGQGEAEGVSEGVRPSPCGRSAQPPRPGRARASSASRSLTPSRSFCSRALPKRRFSPHRLPGAPSRCAGPPGALCQRGAPGLRQTRPGARRAGRQALCSASSGRRDWERRRERELGGPGGGAGAGGSLLNRPVGYSPPGHPWTENPVGGMKRWAGVQGGAWWWRRARGSERRGASSLA